MGCCACCCEAGENPGTCCGNACCRSPDTCCGETKCCRLSDCKVCVEVTEGVFNCVSVCEPGECCVGGLCVPCNCDPPCSGCMECIDGECVSSCASGEYCCNGACQASPCDPPCDPPCDSSQCLECVSSQCVSKCDPGQYCCDGVCQDDPCGTECCCTDNVITEVNDNTAPCEGTTYAKPSAPDLSTISVVVEWCGITLTLNEANDWSAASGKQGIEGGETSCTQPGPYVIQVALAELNAGVGPTVVCNTVVFGLSADTYYWGNPGPGAVRFVGGISGPRCVVSSVIQTGGEGSWCPDGPCPDLPTFTVVGAP